MALTKAQLIDLNANEMIIDLDGDTSITADTDDQIDIKIAGADDFRFTANTFTALSGSTIAAQALTATSITTTGAIAIPNDGNIGSAGDADAIAISSSGVVTFSQSPVFPDGSINVADIDLDGATDIGAAIADADLFLIDDGAGGTMRKATASRIKTYMGAATGEFSVENLDIDGSTDIGANLADADLLIVDDGAGGTNRKTAMSRVKTYVSDLTLTTAAQTNITSVGTLSSLVIADAGNIGSASDTDAIAISSGGVVTMNQIPVFSAGINVSGGSIAGTLSTAAQANITSLGTLTALTVDDITIDGSTISDSGDFTLDVGGDINLDADGADVNIKDDGTTILSFTNSSSDAVITAGVQDKDIIFKGDDGGSAITSLTLDMSNAGAAIFSAAAYNAEATLTDASTISWNAITQPVAKVTLGGNRTLGAASGGVAGAFISLLIIQDGTGSRTVSFNAAYEFAEDTAPTLTTTASKGDLFVFRYNGSKWLEVGRNLALTLS